MKYTIKVIDSFTDGRVSISFESMSAAPEMLATSHSIFNSLDSAKEHLRLSAIAARKIGWKSATPIWVRERYAQQYVFGRSFKRTYVLIEYTGKRSDLIDITKEIFRRN